VTVSRRIVRRQRTSPGDALPNSLHPVLRRVYGARGVRSPEDLELGLERFGLVMARGRTDRRAVGDVDHGAAGQGVLAGLDVETHALHVRQPGHAVGEASVASGLAGGRAWKKLVPARTARAFPFRYYAITTEGDNDLPEVPRCR
jgi:hypothetical protein